LIQAVIFLVIVNSSNN